MHSDQLAPPAPPDASTPELDASTPELDAAEIALLLLERSARRLALLQDITAALAEAVDPMEVASTIAQRVCAAVYADAVSIRRLGPEGLVPLVSKGLQSPGAFVGQVIPLDARLPVIDALASEQGVWIESREQCAAEYPEIAAIGRDEGYDSYAALPLRTRGVVVGSLSLLFKGERSFDSEDRTFLLAVAEQCAQALDRATLFSEERALRAAAERDRAVLDGIFANAPLGIALLDRDLRFVRVNPVLAEWNEAPMEAHAGRSPGEIRPEIGWDALAIKMRKVLDSGAACVVPVSLSVAGRARHFLEAWYPVRVEGAAIGVGAIVREVTAEREAEKFQRHVLGIVGHDLRSPLAAVTTAAQLLPRVGALDERQERLVERIMRGAFRIERVIGLLIDYARAQSGGGIPVTRHECDVAAICRAVAQDCEAAHPDSSIRFMEEGDSCGEWDPDRLGQVLQNLVSNAVEHSAPGAAVDLRCRGDSDHVEVVVENVGSQIAPELLPRLFEPFQRGAGKSGAGSRTGGGLGLGLYIARAIVVAHGGEIEVRSANDRTAFTVRLPRQGPGGA